MFTLTFSFSGIIHNHADKGHHDPDDPQDAKDLFLGLIDDVKKEYGEFDAIMKDGSFISPEKNKQMMSKVYDELDKWNEGVCF